MLRCCRSAIQSVSSFASDSIAIRCSTFAPSRTKSGDAHIHTKLDPGRRAYVFDSECCDYRRHQATSPTTESARISPGPCNTSDGLAVSSGTTVNVEFSLPVDARKQGRDTQALDSLRSFLEAGSSSQTTDIKVPTPNTLRSLYTSAKHRSQLIHLSPSQFTELLSLFGSLSLPKSRSRCQYISALLPFYDRFHETPRTYWSFVLLILRDKARFGHTLSIRDRFWLMRATLGSLHSVGETNATDVGRIIHAARKEYDQIWFHSPHAEVHVPFLKALASLGTPAAIQRLVACLVRLLSHFREPHPQLLQFLWSLTLGLLDHSTPADKERVLCAVRRCRLDLPRLVPPATVEQPPSQAMVLWISAQFDSALDPRRPVEVRWRNLTQLARCSLWQTTSTGFRTADELPALQIDFVQWDVMLILKYLEQSLQLKLTCKPRLQSESSLRDALRSVWRIWKNTPRDPSMPHDVARAIVATFFRLSAVLGDGRLKEACHRFCLAEDLYISDPATELPPLHLVVEFIMASLASDNHSWSAIMSRLDPSLPDASWKPGVLAMSVRHLSREEPSRVFGLHASLFSCLATSHWSAEQKYDLLEALLTILHISGTEKLDVKRCSIVAKAMLDVYTQLSPSKRIRYALQNILSVSVVSGLPSQALAIIQAIHRKSPHFLSDTFLSRFARSLLRQRQFRLASMTLCMFPDASSVHARAIRRDIAINMTRSGATSLARKVFGISQTRRPNAHDPVLRIVKLRSAKHTRLSTLRVMSIVRRSPHDADLLKSAISVLVCAKRFAAARAVFQRTQNASDTALRTTLGNMILNGLVQNMACRNGRLVRNVLRTTEHFTKHYGFTRDRITVNILLKAILRWRAFIDLSKVKALFDHMIRGGYPAAAQFRRGGVPFSTHPSVTAALSLPPLPPHISFLKHVRPMYKMFIKAFHQRGDRRAAGTVIGILKAEEAEERTKREERNRARALTKYIGKKS